MERVLRQDGTTPEDRQAVIGLRRAFYSVSWELGGLAAEALGAVAIEPNGSPRG